MTFSDNDKVFIEKLVEDASFNLAGSFREAIEAIPQPGKPSGKGTDPVDSKPKGGESDEEKGLGSKLGALGKALTGLKIAQAASQKGRDMLTGVINYQNQMMPRLIQTGREGMIKNADMVSQMGSWGLTLSQGGETLQTAMSVGLKSFSEGTKDYLFGAKRLGLGVGLMSKQMAFQTQVLQFGEETSLSLVKSMNGLSQIQGEHGDLLVKAMSEMSNSIVGVKQVFGTEIAQKFTNFAMRAQSSVGEENRKALGKVFEQFAPTTGGARRLASMAGTNIEQFKTDPEAYFRAISQTITGMRNQFQGSPEAFDAVLKDTFQIQFMDLGALDAFNNQKALPTLDDAQAALKDDKTLATTTNLEGAMNKLTTGFQADILPSMNKFTETVAGYGEVLLY